MKVLIKLWKFRILLRVLWIDDTRYIFRIVSLWFGKTINNSIFDSTDYFFKVVDFSFSGGTIKEKLNPRSWCFKFFNKWLFKTRLVA